MPNNNSELEREIEQGKNLAIELVRHANMMASAKLEIPLKLGGAEWVVTAEWKEG